MVGTLRMFLGGHGSQVADPLIEALMRIRQQRLSKRGQTFRQLLGLNRYKFKEINVPKM